MNTMSEKRFSWLQAALVYAFLVIVCGVIYHSTCRYGFYFDDTSNITQRLAVRNTKFSDLFFKNSRWISSWLNTFYFKLNRFDPYYYRLGNLILHIFNGTLLFAILSIILQRASGFVKEYAYPLAAATAGLFLIHPVATQTICYVIHGQLEGLATCAMFLIVLFFVGSVLCNPFFIKLVCGMLVIITCVFSSSTKEIAIISPALVFLVDWFFLAHGNLSEIKKRIWYYLVIVITVLSSFVYMMTTDYVSKIIRSDLQHVSNAGNLIAERHDQKITSLMFACSQCKALIHYFVMYFWPFNLSLDYDSKLPESFWQSDVLISALILVLVFSWIARRLYRNRIDTIAFAFLWFFTCMFLRSSFITSTELAADYKTYTASVGPLFLLSMVIVLLASRMIKNSWIFFWGLLIALLLPWGYGAYQRTMVWSSAENFWQDVANKAPSKARTWNNLGEAQIKNKKFNEAIASLRTAIDLDLQYAEPWNNLAVIYAELGDTDRALATFDRLLKLKPNHFEGYNNLAVLLMEKNELANAEEVLRHVIQRRPYYGKALFNLGRIYFIQNNFEKAAIFFRRACMLADFDNVLGFASWGEACMYLKTYDAAVEAYSRALKLEPNNTNVKRELAYAYLFSGDLQRGEDLLEQVYKSDPSEIKTIIGLADIKLRQKKYGAAWELYKRVEILSPQMPHILLRLARCAFKLKKYDYAESYLQKVLMARPPEELAFHIQELLKSLDAKNYSERFWDFLNKE